MNQAIHTIDLLLAALGQPVEVYARTGLLAHHGLDVENTAVATVAFASGAMGLVHATTAAFPGLEASLRVFGDRGSVVMVDDELVTFYVDGEGAPVPVPVSGPGPGRGPAALGPSHARQVEDFVTVVRARQAGDQRARPRVGTTEGRTALALVLAMYESASTGRPVRASEVHPGTRFGEPRASATTVRPTSCVTYPRGKPSASSHSDFPGDEQGIGAGEVGCVAAGRRGQTARTRRAVQARTVPPESGSRCEWSALAAGCRGRDRGE
jgi:hypothetical protein